MSKYNYYGAITPVDSTDRTEDFDDPHVDTQEVKFYGNMTELALDWPNLAEEYRDKCVAWNKPTPGVRTFKTEDPPASVPYDLGYILSLVDPEHPASFEDLYEASLHPVRVAIEPTNEQKWDEAIKNFDERTDFSVDYFAL